jgi:hypothetical protein
MQSFCEDFLEGLSGKFGPSSIGVNDSITTIAVKGGQECLSARRFEIFI